MQCDKNKGQKKELELSLRMTVWSRIVTGHHTTGLKYSDESERRRKIRLLYIHIGVQMSYTINNLITVHRAVSGQAFSNSNSA